MIVVKVEIWPGGSYPRRRVIQELRIANISSLAEVSDYYYELMEPDLRLGVQKEGYIRRHVRADGVLKLLARVLEQIEEPRVCNQ